MRWLSEVRERVRALVFRSRVDADTEEEMRFHVEMEAARLQRDAGLGPAEARRRALLSFGGVERHRAAVSDARGMGWLSGTSLDVKLGARMLGRYPGLTLAGGLSLAVAVGLAAAWFQFLNDMTRPRLPLPDADRIVVVHNFDRATATPEQRMLHDFEWWRSEVRSVEQLSASSTSQGSVTTEDGRVVTLRLARLTASAFGVLGVSPVMGRAFVEADEQRGSEVPVLLSHDAWQQLFDGDAGVIGRSLRVAGTDATVVGVMAEGFGFPVNQQAWLPLRERADDWERRTGPGVTVFGRLARGATVRGAQAELTALGERAAAAYPDTHEHLRPDVRPYAAALGMHPAIALLNVPFLLFLVVVCANVAALVFARNVARSGELALRSALGASRRRLVLQLVAEALVLTLLATALGLVLAQAAFSRAMALFWEVQQSAPPFWFQGDITATTVFYAIALAALAALIIGGLPALKATGRQLRHRLSQPGTGGAAPRFGRFSTAVIVVQVALCVAFLPAAILRGGELMEQRPSVAAFPSAEYLTGRVSLEQGAASRAAGTSAGAIFDELKQRLQAERGVLAAAFASRMPGFNHPVERLVVSTDTALLLQARVMAVDEDFFDVVGARVVHGRPFVAGDASSTVRPLVVDEEWAATQFAGRNAVGQRVRFPGRDPDRATWYEIVGVVAGMSRATGPGAPVALFEPLRAADPSRRFYLRTSAPPAALAASVHGTITALDARLAIDDLQPLDEAWRPAQQGAVYIVAGLNLVALVILTFALIGIYSLMSFTVAQRTREIAIRTALGANPRRLLVAIFSRALVQIGGGVLIGAVVIGAAIARTPASALLVVGVATAMLLVGVGGCAVPAVRALRIPPTAALKQE